MLKIAASGHEPETSELVGCKVHIIVHIYTSKWLRVMNSTVYFMYLICCHWPCPGNSTRIFGANCSFWLPPLAAAFPDSSVFFFTALVHSASASFIIEPSVCSHIRGKRKKKKKSCTLPKFPAPVYLYIFIYVYIEQLDPPKKHNSFKKRKKKYNCSFI